MKWLLRLTVLGCLAASAIAADTGPEVSTTPKEEPGAGTKLMSRIDFGNSYILGQSIKSGAVYLLNRKRSEIGTMLKVRTDFRDEIRDDAEVVSTGNR